MSTASKAALLAMSDSLRTELHPFGVGVTYVCAGSIQSSFSDNALAGMGLERYQAAGSAYNSMAASIK